MEVLVVSGALTSADEEANGVCVVGSYAGGPPEAAAQLKSAMAQVQRRLRDANTRDLQARRRNLEILNLSTIPLLERALEAARQADNVAPTLIAKAETLMGSARNGTIAPDVATAEPSVELKPAALIRAHSMALRENLRNAMEAVSQCLRNIDRLDSRAHLDSELVPTLRRSLASAKEAKAVAPPLIANAEALLEQAASISAGVARGGKPSGRLLRSGRISKNFIRSDSDFRFQEELFRRNFERNQKGNCWNQCKEGEGPCCCAAAVLCFPLTLLYFGLVINGQFDEDDPDAC